MFKQICHTTLLYTMLLGSAFAAAQTCNDQGVVTNQHRDQAKRIYQRLTGVPPTAGELNEMAAALACNDAGFEENATAIPLDDDNFYNVTLKNFVTPWTNEEQTVFAPLNDYTATVIGMVYNDDDFREVLYGDYIYTAANLTGVPAYSTTDNDHYEALEEQGVSLKDNLVKTPQAYLPENARAGVITSRAAAKAFFIDGTNRAMFRFTLMNHLCRDLEQVKDITRSPDRIRQDVSRSPGGDSRIFLNSCVGCHSGMDPMAQAYAYYEYRYDSETDPDALNGEIEYTPDQVQPKYHINSSNFPYGYVTPDEHWTNYWREGVNKHLGWDASLDGYGVGARSMGMELAHSEVFAECQVEKVFQAVCLREPLNAADQSEISQMLTDFAGVHNYRLKPVFSDAALYCKGE